MWKPNIDISNKQLVHVDFDSLIKYYSEVAVDQQLFGFPPSSSK